METFKSVRQSIMINDWAVSIDLTDAYFHVPIHPRSRKYLRFIYEHQVFQFMTLPFGMSLSPWIFTKLMNVIATHLRLRAVSLPIPRRLANKRSDSQSTYLSHKIHSSKGTKSGFYTKSKEVRFDTNTRIHLYRYGISNSVDRVKALILTIKTILSQTQILARTSLSLLGKLSAAADLIRQTAFTTSANVHIISLETSRSSLRSSGYDQQYDQSPFEMMDEYQSLRSRYAHSLSRPQDIHLYGCQLFQLGSSSGTDESILSWSLVG